MESVRLRLVAHIILAVCSLPVVNFFLAGADIIALVVLPDLSPVCPQAAESQRGGAGERQLAVDQDFPLNVRPAACGGQVIQPDIVQACLRNVYLPGDFRLIRRQYAFILGRCVPLKGKHVHGDLFRNRCFSGV